VIKHHYLDPGVSGHIRCSPMRCFRFVALQLIQDCTILTADCSEEYDTQSSHHK